MTLEVVSTASNPQNLNRLAKALCTLQNVESTKIYQDDHVNRTT